MKKRTKQSQVKTVDVLAIEIMEWKHVTSHKKPLTKKQREEDDWPKRFYDEWLLPDGTTQFRRTWNPLEDENDFRVLLEKIMKNEELWYQFIEILTCHVKDRDEDSIVGSYCKATLPERCSALIEVLNSK